MLSSDLLWYKVAPTAAALSYALQMNPDSLNKENVQGKQFCL